MPTMTAGQSVLTIDPTLGGAVTSWTRAGHPILHPVTDPKLVQQRGQPVAAYPLIPFSNRVGNGRFSFEGSSYQLDPNFTGEPHTIHGNAWMRPWTVLQHDEGGTSARSDGGTLTVLALDHAPPADPAGQWPFAYHAEIAYHLTDNALSVTIHVRNTDHRPQPVGLGFHPFFPRSDDLELGFSASSVWISGPDSLPADRQPATGEYGFSPMRPVSGTALDNCFAGWTGTAFLRWPNRNLTLTITAAAPYEHLVVFTPPGQDFIAVEPASNMTDAINHPEIADRGLTILAPGKTVSARVDFTLAGL